MDGDLGRGVSGRAGGGVWDDTFMTLRQLKALLGLCKSLACTGS